jgi:MFS transporter, ACS family, hexuronate transporter
VAPLAVQSPLSIGNPTPRTFQHFRWTICALLFLATTINYVHRQIFSILAPTLEHEIHWTEVEYAYIITAFQGAYAIGLILLGRLMDRFGTRRGFAFVISIWSLAAMAHALATSTLGFATVRFALGLGEAGNFPASIKTVAEWFPKQERALATGIFNAGANIGAVVAPAIVPWIALHYGWRWSFVITGSFGFVWLVLWLTIYRKPAEHPRVSAAELAYIQSDPIESTEPVAWARLLRLRQTWAFALGKFLTDPVWWFYLFWVPKFLNKQYGLTLDKIGPPLIIIYLASDVGSVGGGWLSSALLKRGWSVNSARKMALLVCAISVLPIVFAGRAASLWMAVALLSLATAAHQGWSANLFTLTSDMFPRRAVGSIVGIGGTLGAIGGMLVATASGFILQWTGSYLSLFIMAGSMYLVALAVIQWLAPRLEPAKL